MAALATARPYQTRPRVTVNGGLGGLVKLEVKVQSLVEDEFGTWPKTGRRKLGHIGISSYKRDRLLSPAPSWSVISHQGKESTWTLSLPSSFGPEVGQNTATHSQQTTPSMSPLNFAITTPTKPILPDNAPAFELPGSLLLPSQGFAPPPATPPRNVVIQRRNTNDSETSSVPSLSTSVSTPPDNMDLLRGHWRTPHLNGLSSQCTSHNKAFGVSRPFSAMSMEELLDSLTSCDTTTVVRAWLPEMQKRCSNIKTVLQRSQSTNESHTDLKNIGNDLKNFMQEARTISNTYSNALKSAESLLERDTLYLQEQLHTTERELKRANAKIEASDRLLLEKKEALGRLHDTHKEVVRILGSFIQKHVEHWVKDFYESDTQAVMQVISDNSQNCDENQGPHIRIPESVHLEYISLLSEAEQQIAQYRDIIGNQDKTIKDQSSQLDVKLSKYEETLKVVKERDHEVLLLCQQNTALEAKVESYEVALQRSQAVVTERDRAKKDGEELRQEIKQLNGLMKLQFEEKDSTITELRQQLAIAHEEVIARRADVKNVITQTQAMLVPRENSSNSDRLAVSKSPRSFGKRNEKVKSPKTHLPKSSSGIFLGFQHLNYDMMTSPKTHPDSKYSSKEAVACDKTHLHLSCGNSSSSSARTNSSTPTRGRRSSDPFCDMKYRPDSRGTSRDNSSLRSQGSGSTTANTQKQLPAAPPALLPQVPSSSSLLHPDDALVTRSPRSSQGAVHTGLRTPARRILSLIPEASVEDSDSIRAPSATSSEKEMYRSSIHALDALNSSSIEDDTSEARSASATATVTEANGARKDTGSRNSSDGSLSDVLTVSQMYHGGNYNGGMKNGQGHIRS